MASLDVQALSLQPSKGGCSANLAAGVTDVVGDRKIFYDVTSKVDCVQDHVGPSFSAGDEASPINPVDLGRIGADKPVIPPPTASLVDAGGNTIVLDPIPDWGSAPGASRMKVTAALASVPPPPAPSPRPRGEGWDEESGSAQLSAVASTSRP